MNYGEIGEKFFIIVQGRVGVWVPFDINNALKASMSVRVQQRLYEDKIKSQKSGEDQETAIDRTNSAEIAIRRYTEGPIRSQNVNTLSMPESKQQSKGATLSTNSPNDQ